jgi:hypothetical protein
MLDGSIMGLIAGRGKIIPRLEFVFPILRAELDYDVFRIAVWIRQGIDILHAFGFGTWVLGIDKSLRTIRRLVRSCAKLRKWRSS